MKKVIISMFALAGGLLLAGCVHTPQAPTTPTPTPNTGNNSQQTNLPSTVELAYVIYEDGGQQGTGFGCNDSLVTTQVTPPSNITTWPALINRSYNQLFAQAGMQSGWNSAIPTQGLTVDSVIINNNSATVALSGTLSLGGVCDNPRAEEQLMFVIDQFPHYSNNTVTIDGQSLDQYLSLQ